eukprot:g24917.t1
MAEVLESVSEVLEDVAELPRSRRFPPLRLLPPLPGPNMVDAADDVGSSIRTASAPWWEALSDGSNEWSMDEFTEYTLDSQADTSRSTLCEDGQQPTATGCRFHPRHPWRGWQPPHLPTRLDQHWLSRALSNTSGESELRCGHAAPAPHAHTQPPAEPSSNLGHRCPEWNKPSPPLSLPPNRSCAGRRIRRMSGPVQQAISVLPMMRPALAMASLAVGASASIGSQAVGLPRGAGWGPPNLMDPQLLQDSCSRLANFTSSASPILAYGKTVQGWPGGSRLAGCHRLNGPTSCICSRQRDWLRLNEPSCQIFVASAALIAGLCLTWDGPQLWKALFTLALACAAAFAARFEAEAWHLQIFSIFTVMCQAAVIVGTAVYWGFEGSQVLLGSCCGFAGAYGMGAWVRSLDATAPGLAMFWYICGSVLGIQIFTAWRRGVGGLSLYFLVNG